MPSINLTEDMIESIVVQELGALYRITTEMHEALDALEASGVTLRDFEVEDRIAQKKSAAALAVVLADYGVNV